MVSRCDKIVFWWFLRFYEVYERLLNQFCEEVFSHDKQKMRPEISARISFRVYCAIWPCVLQEVPRTVRKRNFSMFLELAAPENSHSMFSLVLLLKLEPMRELSRIVKTKGEQKPLGDRLVHVTPNGFRCVTSGDLFKYSVFFLCTIISRGRLKIFNAREGMACINAKFYLMWLRVAKRKSDSEIALQWFGLSVTFFNRLCCFEDCTAHVHASDASKFFLLFLPKCFVYFFRIKLTIKDLSFKK